MFEREMHAPGAIRRARGLRSRMNLHERLPEVALRDIERTAWLEGQGLLPLPLAAEAIGEVPEVAGAELKLIKDCGHLPMFEKEAEFVAAITQFCLA